MATDTSADPALEDLLRFIRDQRGFDFTGYKRGSLQRRTDKRMQALGITGYDAYRDHLEVTAEEFDALFDTILINVTRFFRDPEAWQQLRDQVLPGILPGPEGTIRAWVAGCASGEEAYTLAMVLAELMGADRVRDAVKIYATDVDEQALDVARKGVYDDRAVDAIPEALRGRHIVRHGDRWVIHPDLRRAVIFGRHDLLRDAPIGRIDVLSCRNTLMYFNAETQAHVVRRLHFALADRGVLQLGRVETLLSHGDLFEPVDLHRRIFRKVVHPDLQDRLRDIVHAPTGLPAEPAAAERRLRQVFDDGPSAQLVVDGNGVMVLANRRARATFGLTTADDGRAFSDLELSYNPVELRSPIDRVVEEGRQQVVDDVVLRRPGQDPLHLQVRVTPLPPDGREENGAPAAARPGVVLTFLDRSTLRRLEHELHKANHDLGTAYEELQSTNEELETTNEELQSTNEELETTNEELQSTNEELETMNVELQAINHELHTINDELAHRSEDLDGVNAFLESILANLEGGVVVVDDDLAITVWNPGAVDLWGLREDEAIGTKLLSLDIGLPVAELAGPLHEVLSGTRPRSRALLTGRDRLGRDVTIHVVCGPLLDRARRIRGAIVRFEVDDPTRKGEDGGSQPAAAPVTHPLHGDAGGTGEEAGR